MSKKIDYIETFITKMGDSLVNDLKKIVPKHIETILEQRFKGIMTALSPIDRIEAEFKQIGKDVEDLKIAYQALREDVAELKINAQTLPKEVKETVAENTKDLAGALAQDIKEMNPKKKRAESLLKFWKRKK